MVVLTFWLLTLGHVVIACPSIGSSRTTRLVSAAISFTASIELVHLERLHLEIAEKPSAEGRQAAVTPVDLACQGPVRVDFMEKLVTLEEHVELRRHTEDGIVDTLQCQKLSLHLSQPAARSADEAPVDEDGPTIKKPRSRAPGTRERVASLPKLEVAKVTEDYIRRGGFVFAMCSACETIDIALSAENVDICPAEFDGDPVDPGAQKKLDFSQTLAFENFRVTLDPMLYRHSNIDTYPDRIVRFPDPQLDYFYLFEFSAKLDPVPTMLVQNHVGRVKGFMGQTRVLLLTELSKLKGLQGALVQSSWIRRPSINKQKFIGRYRAHQQRSCHHT